MNHPTLIERGRRSAEIDGNHVRLFNRDNLRKPPRAIRQGTRTLPSIALCWHAAVMWTQKGAIDFGEADEHPHRRKH